MGFVDLSGSLGRHFGSIGVALDEYVTQLSVASSDQRNISGPSAHRADKCLTQFCEALQVSDRLAIRIEKAIPEHIGLGSGTQMALAIGSALNAFYGLGLTIRELASVMERGLRSGIGIGIFERGGLVLDGGRGEQTIIPPVLVHLDIPESWRFVLVLDERGQGFHGQQEIQAFKALPKFPAEEAARLCYLLLMQGLPAVAEQNIGQFGEVITQLQQSVGTHFASVQGDVFTSAEVAEVMAWFVEQGAVGIGQTSWGPTGFCIFDGVEKAEMATRQARETFSGFEHLSFVVTAARNHGAQVICSE